MLPNVSFSVEESCLGTSLHLLRRLIGSLCQQCHLSFVQFTSENLPSFSNLVVKRYDGGVVEPNVALTGMTELTFAHIQVLDLRWIL